ncbi:MAG: hypothetical protein CVV05_14790 [Gammaproteobacteria bacterium HGW-Gammaproteobacteria-1]|jgi:hypothetical protein|nr:MAG: hypothetical protein CVV05_14790 [Gammaproteobacteria bacterium HGW-Gammaproteobacteria-1]
MNANERKFEVSLNTSIESRQGAQHAKKTAGEAVAEDRVHCWVQQFVFLGVLARVTVVKFASIGVYLRTG